MWSADGLGNQVLYTKDISSTGMCLQGVRQIEWHPDGNNIGLKSPVLLYLPGESPLTELEVELKWQDDQNGQVLSGWEFTSITPESKRLLYEKIENLLPSLSENTDDFSSLEKVIEAKRGTRFFYDVGKALEKIRDLSLYKKEGYPDFMVYCQQRWAMSPRKSFQFINAATIVDNISAQGASVLPQNEAQVKPLAILLPDIQSKVWQAVLSTTADGHVTESLVEEVVNRFLRGEEWSFDSGDVQKTIQKEDAFTQKLGEAKRAFKQLCKVVTESDSIEEVRSKVEKNGGQYFWKNLSIVFRSNFAEGADGTVEFKGFNAEMQLWQEDQTPPQPFPCWKILGIEPGATKETAKKARDRLIKQYHPDRIPQTISPEFRDLATQRTREINKAYAEFTSL